MSKLAKVQMHNGRKYRYITTKIVANRHTDNIINDFNKHFDADDIFVRRNKNNLDIYLRQLDHNLLDSVINAKLQKYKTTNIITKIISEINKVRSYGIHSGIRVYVDYNNERKVLSRKKKEQSRGKHYYANGNDFSRGTNSVPGKFLNKIICGDSELVLKKLPDSCIDLVFTSPPYNFGLDYNEPDDAINWNKYFQKLFAIFDECVRVLKFGGRLIVNVQPLFSDYVPSHHLISTHLMSKKMIWKGEILWEKNNYNCKYTAWGSWKSPSAPYLKYTWEFIEVFCKGDLKKDGPKQDIDITSEQFKKWVVAKWNVAPERNMKGYEHPAMFPEEIAKRVLLLFSFKNDIVLDPFNGAGTTSAVARNHNRNFVGIDTVEKYCKIAKKRIAQQRFK